MGSYAYNTIGGLVCFSRSHFNFLPRCLEKGFRPREVSSTMPQFASFASVPVARGLVWGNATTRAADDGYHYLTDGVTRLAWQFQMLGLCLPR